MSVIQINKGKNESFESMFRRFKSRERDSGKQLTVKGGRFFARKPSKNKTHESALRRLVKTAKLNYLLQSGKLDPKDIRNFRG